MSQPITLFSGYSQSENRTTNYCLLMLKMLYDESPLFLGQVLTDLLGVGMSKAIGVNFRQQEWRDSSVPDGLISQAPVTVYIETKHYDWFYDDQLEHHLDHLAEEQPGLNVLLALGRFETDTDQRFRRIIELTSEKYQGRVSFGAVSFEDFLAVIRSVDGLSPSTKAAVDDLRQYFDEQGLLLSWPDLLDVVNCAGTPHEVTDGGVYMCPATAGAYSHQRCKYFGLYRNKTVEAVALIEAVVEVELGLHERIQWKNVERDDDELKRIARERLSELRPGAEPSRVFILGGLVPTDFRKDSKGGMLGSKRYFNIAPLKAGNVHALAAALEGKCWSDSDFGWAGLLANMGGGTS